MRFSQRSGIIPIQKVIQIGVIDDDLRNSLWSLLTLFYWNAFNKAKYGFMNKREDYIEGSNLEELFKALWLHYFKKPIDTIPILFYNDDGGLGLLRTYFFKAKWYEVYDFVEFISAYSSQSEQAAFFIACNEFLERENSGYRFVDGKIIEISSSDEVTEIERAIEQSTPYYGVKQHLSTAIALLSKKDKPDYRNSIKESISAVESLCRTVSKDEKATLGAALKSLEKKGTLHPALKSAFSSLYGYSNDAEGIRHALMEASNLNSADARFMLISCSAFINYVISATVTEI